MTRSVVFFSPFSEFRLFTRVGNIETVLINMMRLLQRSTDILGYITSMRGLTVSGSERTLLPSPSNLVQALHLSSPRQGMCGLNFIPPPNFVLVEWRALQMLWLPGSRIRVWENQSPLSGYHEVMERSPK